MTALLLSALCAVQPAAVLAAKEAPSAEVVLEAEDGVMDMGQPFRSPTMFTLRRGEADMFMDRRKELLPGASRWQIQIYDFDDRKVAYIQGLGQPTTAPIKWDGVGQDGALLRDGYYTTRLVWVDGAGAAHRSADVKVGLMTPPQSQDLNGLQIRMIYTPDGIVLQFSSDATFPTNEFALRPEITDTLLKTAAYLRQYPKNRLMILGHSDSTGSEQVNLTLSRRRARSVYNYLIEHGIAADRLSYQGQGSSQPISSNDTAEGRKQNRRLEIRLLKTLI